MSETKSVRERHSGGRFLAKEDIPGDWHRNGLVLTVDSFSEENVAREDQKAQLKPIMSFQDADVKPMVLNKGNNKLTLKWWKSDDDAKGSKVLVYVDPTVTDQNDKVVGGLRLGLPSEKEAEPDDQIPF